MASFFMAIASYPYQSNRSGVPGLTSNSYLGGITFGPSAPLTLSGLNNAVTSGGVKYDYSNAKSVPQTPQVLGMNNFDLVDSNSRNKNVNTPTQNNSGQVNSTNSVRDAELSSANTEFDRTLADLDAQLKGVYSQQDNAIAGLETAQQGLLSQVEQQKAGVMRNQEDAIGQASDTARNAQRSNRNILRALGILNSSYATDKLTQPNEDFAKVRAGIVQQATDRINELDTFANQKKAEFVNTVASVKQQFAQMVDQINRDVRFTDRQRADQLRTINAAYNDKLLQLKTGTQSVLDQVEQTKQNFISGNVQNLLTANPDLAANIGDINTSVSNLRTVADSIFGPSQASIVTDPKKKQQFPAGAIGSTPNGGYLFSTLSGSGY